MAGAGIVSQPGCGNCARPSSDGADLCTTCAAELQKALRRVPGLLDDLLVTFAKQDRLTTAGGRGKLSEAPLPVRFDVRRVIDALSNEVTTWARVLVELHGLDVPDPPRRSAHNGDRGVVFPASSPAVDLACFAAEWLAEHVGHLRMHPAALEAYNGLTDAISAAQMAIDRSDDRTRFPVGPCPENDDDDQPCTGQVWAHVPTSESDPAALRCGVCGATWDTTRWHRTGARIAARRWQLDQAVN